MGFHKFLACLTCLFFIATPVGAVPIDKAGHTWADLQKLAKNDLPIFFTNCVYSKDKYRWVMYFPAGKNVGWLALLMEDGRDYHWGVANIGKASNFGANIGFGFQTQRITKFIGNELFNSKFILLKPKDFHLVFDGKPSFTCPDSPEYVLSGMGAPITDAGVTLPIREAEQLASFRPKLLKQGWIPVETYGRGVAQSFAHSEGPAGTLYSAGFKEVEYCSENYYCILNYVRNGERLKVMTDGRFGAGSQPTISSWKFEYPEAPTKAPVKVR